MLCFFHMTEDIKVEMDQSGFQYIHEFKGAKNQDEVSIESIYATTPSDYRRICEAVKASGNDDKKLCRLLSVKEIVEHEQMPKQVSFKDSIKEAFEPFKDKDKVTIAVTNAMSNAIGDHLIGMNAFGVFQERLKELYPDKEFVFNLFQLNPYKLATVTKQWEHLYNNVGTMPTQLNLFFSHDAYMDFGGLLLINGFDTMPMFDFFLKGFSIKGEDVPPEKKQLKYKTLPATDFISKILTKHVRKRANGRQVVLVHPMATTPIRTMPKDYANNLVAELNKEGYFTVSAVGIPTKSKSHMNLHNFSTEIDDFAAIIRSVDGIVTVDTSTTHIADCFDIPTVVIFTSIDPKYRIPYYPNAKGVMIEEEGGMLHGKHKFDPNTDAGKKADEYAIKLWKKYPPKEIVSELREMLVRSTTVPKNL